MGRAMKARFGAGVVMKGGRVYRYCNRQKTRRPYRKAVLEMVAKDFVQGREWWKWYACGKGWRGKR